MSYIKKESLLEEFNSLEQLARKRVYDTPTNSPAYERYSAQYHERERALSIIKAQPDADVVPRSDYDSLKREKELLEQDIADRDKMLESKVEEVYAEFMTDYKIMREEWQAALDALTLLEKKYEGDQNHGKL